VDLISVELLQAVEEHWAVLLVQNIRANMDLIVSTDAEKIIVEGAMMKLAQGDPIRHSWRSLWF